AAAAATGIATAGSSPGTTARWVVCRIPTETTRPAAISGPTAAPRLSPARSRLLQSGAMHVVQEDGSEQEIRAGQAYVIEPGHDAWVVGDEAVVGFEFDSRTAEEYAKS